MMTEAQNDPPPDFDAKLALLDGKLEAISNLAQAVQGIMQIFGASAQQMSEGSSLVRDKVLPLMDRISAEQDQLRALILRRTESLQDTMDSVRQTTHNAWNTANFAITHSVGNNLQTREEVEKLLTMVLGVQRQQQLLASQVEELRRAAAEKEGGGPPGAG